MTERGVSTEPPVEARGPERDGARVAVLGAGMAGLTAAHRLARNGVGVDVYERWPGLGGQVATLDVGGADPVERYYHHLFSSDVHIAELYTELGMPDAIEWRPSSVALFSNGRSYPFVSPLDLLRFSPLSIRGRLRLALGTVRAMRHRDHAEVEDETARAWVERNMGSEAWEKVWGPLMRGKFGSRADEISMAWLWARITVRRRMRNGGSRKELLGYPRGSWQPLLERLRAEIEARGGRVLIDRPAVRISRAGSRLAVASGAADSWRRGHDPRRFDSHGDALEYDTVLATVPNDVFLGMLDDELQAEIGPDYRGRLEGVEYHTALCLLLELDRSFTPFYWTSVADPEIPFVGLIEQTRMIDPSRYGGRHLLYVANYVAADDPLLRHDPGALIEAYGSGLRRINPEFSNEWIRAAHVFREPAAQPVVTVGYGARIPAIETGAPGLLLANTTQIYPQDRGTNYSVDLGERAAQVALHHRVGTAR